MQHHFKYCATYCVFYQLMEDLEERVQSNEIIKDEKYKKLSQIYQSKQAQHLRQLKAKYPQAFTSAANSELFERTTHLFERAAKLSEELLDGQAETATFNCDRYEKYINYCGKSRG